MVFSYLLHNSWWISIVVWVIKPCLLLPPLHHVSYRKVSNISRTLVGYEIVDHSDVVGAPPVGAAPTTSAFST